ncbi:MAG: hypothetical protein JNJ57_08880 [Saprospiraceae bacterium]|nr:hypothetical protein [Saprospiraceae bacterium]
MKQKSTFKSLFLAASIFSLFAFVFVNVQSKANMIPTGAPTTLVQPQMVEENENEEREVAVPDVTVLGRLWEIAQRLLDRRG